MITIFYDVKNVDLRYFTLQESIQKEAFEALQLQKDAKHNRLTGQISLIEQELAQLTLLEVEQREHRLESQQVSNAKVEGCYDV